MSRVIRRDEVTDEERERLQGYFEKEQRARTGQPRRDARELFTRILWIAGSGASLRDLPERYGPWQTVYKRFVEWQESGLPEQIFHVLAGDADLQDISIDST